MDPYGMGRQQKKKSRDVLIGIDYKEIEKGISTIASQYGNVESITFFGHSGAKIRFSNELEAQQMVKGEKISNVETPITISHQPSYVFFLPRHLERIEESFLLRVKEFFKDEGCFSVVRQRKWVVIGFSTLAERDAALENHNTEFFIDNIGVKLYKGSPRGGRKRKKRGLPDVIQEIPHGRSSFYC